jgi:hypothetical protein
VWATEGKEERMRAVLLIVLGVFVGYQLGKAAQRRSEAAFEDGTSDAISGRGKKIAGLAAAASMAAVHRVRSNAASH